MDNHQVCIQTDIYHIYIIYIIYIYIYIYAKNKQLIEFLEITFVVKQVYSELVLESIFKT